MSDSTCSVEGCDGKLLARGWCRKHYQRWYVDGDVADKAPQPAVICSVEGCGVAALARGWCRNHYYRWYNLGDPLANKPRERKPIEERLWSKVDMSGGPDACWPWTGSIDTKGYGVLRVDQTNRKPHRIVYELNTGQELGEAWLDHICSNRACCNPAHMRLGADKYVGITEKRCTRCKRVKPITEFNRSRGNNSGYQSACRSCQQDRQQDHYARNREKVIERTKIWASNNPEKVKVAARKGSRRRRYGLVPEEFDRLIGEQGGKCANTGCLADFTDENPPHVDHDHDTGAVRGLLCGNCNRALGLLGDSPERSVGLAQYIEKDAR